MGLFDSQKTPEEIYSAALPFFSQNPLFNLSLALHYYAPKIEAYYQFYHNYVIPNYSKDVASCRVWVELNYEPFCNLSDLKAKWNQRSTSTEAPRQDSGALNYLVPLSNICHSITFTLH